MAKTVVGLFHDHEHARMAVQDLVDLGIPRSDVSLMTRQEGESQGLTTGTTPVDADRVDTTRTEADESAAAGAGVGALVGGIGGLLVGTGLLVIPGIGPILAAGPLVAALTGAALGAGVGALVGALVGMGVPEEEAQYYAEGVRRGGTLVAVTSPDEMVARVTDVLRRHNPVDIKRQATLWRQSGWTGYDPNAQPYTQEQLDRERSMWAPTTDDTASTYQHERETVGQQTTTRNRDQSQSGGSSYSSDTTMHGGTGSSYGGTDTTRHTGTGTMTPDNTGMSTPSGTSTTRPHGTGTTGHTGTGGSTSYAGSSTHFGTDTTRETTQHDVRPWTDYETDFRRDFERRWRGTNATWDKYEPAYHYAYDTANDPRYQNRSWNDAESDLRRDWEARHQDTTWDDIKDAVREAWDRVRGR